MTFLVLHLFYNMVYLMVYLIFDIMLCLFREGIKMPFRSDGAIPFQNLKTVIEVHISNSSFNSKSVNFHEMGYGPM